MVLYLQEENQKMQTYFKKKDETAIFGPIFAKKILQKKNTYYFWVLMVVHHGPLSTDSKKRKKGYLDPFCDSFGK